MNDRFKKIVLSPLCVVTVLLLVKLYLTRIVIFQDFHVGRLAVISLQSLLVAMMLIELFAKKRRFLWYLTINLLFTGIFFAAIMYHKYYGVIVTYKALAQVGQVFQVRASVMSLTAPYYLLMFIDVVAFLVLYYTRSSFKDWIKRPTFLDRRLAATILAVSLLASYANIISNTHIFNEIKKAEKMGILNYEVYEMITAFQPTAEASKSITLNEIRKIKGISTLKEEERQHWGIAKDRNVIVIQLESLQNFLIGLEVGGQEITPVLNRLAREHFYFPNIYQQIGQGNTSDAEYMLNTSLYIPPDGAASQKYGDKDLPSFPKVLKRHGYTSMTFHTNAITFWNRDSLYTALGIDKMYDEDFFGTEDLIAFGASDEVLYTKTLPELVSSSEKNQKFYANVISMSSHHPYHLPEDKQMIDLPEQFENTLVGRYLESAYYADYALGQFIAALQESGLWDNSMIVIYGDHFGLPMNSLDKTDLKLMEQLTGREYAYPVVFNIPLIISVPGQTEGMVFQQVGGQIDFMPTMANLLGISLERHIHFGQDLLNNSSNLLPKRYYLPTGSFLNDEVVFIPGEGIADAKTYSLGTSAGGVQNDYEEQFERALKLLQLSDGYVQSLPNRK